MNLKDIERIMKENGKSETFERYEIPYRRFKSRSTSKEIKLKEIIFFIERRIYVYKKSHELHRR